MVRQSNRGCSKLVRGVKGIDTKVDLTSVVGLLIVRRLKLSQTYLDGEASITV